MRGFLRVFRNEIAAGRVIICKNKHRAHGNPVGIGRHLTTKVNANIGSSEAHADLNVELEKLRVAIKAGADAVMDLSTGGPIKEIRQAVLKEASIPIGTFRFIKPQSIPFEKERKGLWRCPRAIFFPRSRNRLKKEWISSRSIAA